MEFVQQKLTQLRESWNQLSTSGRLALGLAVVLVVAMLFIVSQYAGEPERVALPTTFEPDELGRAVAALRGQQIDAEARGGQVYVPAGERNLALGMLAYSDAMPESGVSFEKLFDGGGIFEPEADKQRKARYFLKRELEDCIRQMPGVRAVTVRVNFGSKYTIRTQPDGVSASIGVKTSAGQPLDKRLARAMANMVSGSVHGLSTENVKVVDLTTGRTFNMLAEAGVYNDDYVQMVSSYNMAYEGQLQKHFSNIPGVHISVNVVPNIRPGREQKRAVDPKNKIEGSFETSESKSTGGGAGGEVGVVANVGEGGGGTATAMSEQDLEERAGSPRDWGTSVTETEIPPGEITEITAAISVPRSYLETIARIDAGPVAEGEEPKPVDQATIDNVMAREKPRIAKQAAKIIGAAEADAVDVDWHYDVAPDEALLAAATAAGPGILDMVGKHGPTTALGLFAALALFMVYNVVRKFQPAEVPVDHAASDETADAGLTLDSILEGVELEADTIRTSKMQEQISNMVKDDPESVASLIKRWVVQE